VLLEEFANAVFVPGKTSQTASVPSYTFRRLALVLDAEQALLEGATYGLGGSAGVELFKQVVDAGGDGINLHAEVYGDFVGAQAFGKKSQDGGVC